MDAKVDIVGASVVSQSVGTGRPDEIDASDVIVVACVVSHDVEIRLVEADSIAVVGEGAV